MTGNKILVQCLYVVTFDTPITLPSGLTTGDIKEAYVKWNTLHVTFHNGQTWMYELSEESDDGIASHRPLETRVYPINEDDTCSYDETIIEEFS